MAESSYFLCWVASGEAYDVLLFELCKARIQQNDNIGLNDRIGSQFNIKRCHKPLSQTSQFDVGSQVSKDFPNNPLMRPTGRRCHIEDSIHNFIARPIVWKG